MRGEQSEIHLAGTVLQPHRHVCAFFHSRDEEYQVLLPFIKEGIERGEKAFHIVDPKLQDNHRQRLGTAGLNTAELEHKKQLEVCLWADAYLRSDGRFDQNDMLSFIQGVLRSGKADGFPLTRLIAHMEWSLEDSPGVNDIMEYESRLNDVLPKFDDPVLCTYDLARFDAATIMDILRVHPMVIIGGILQVNPFYVSPAEYVAELRARTKHLV